MRRSTPDLAKYRLLMGVEPGASPEQLKQAYRDLVKVWHPDRFASDEGLQKRAEEKLKEINEAYDVLKELGTSSSASAGSGGDRPSRQPFGTPPPSYPAPSKGADERFLHSFVWIVLTLFAIFLVCFVFYLYGKPVRTPAEISLKHIV